MDLDQSHNSEYVADNHIQQAAETKTVPLDDTTKVGSSSPSLSPQTCSTLPAIIDNNMSLTTADIGKEDNLERDLKNSELEVENDEKAVPLVRNAEEPMPLVEKVEEPMSLMEKVEEPMPLVENAEEHQSLRKNNVKPVSLEGDVERSVVLLKNFKQPMSLLDGVEESQLLVDSAKDPASLVESVSVHQTDEEQSTSNTNTTHAKNVNEPNTSVISRSVELPKFGVARTDEEKDAAEHQSVTSPIGTVSSITAANSVQNTGAAKTGDGSQCNERQPMDNTTTEPGANVTTDQLETLTVESSNEVVKTEKLNSQTTVMVKLEESVDVTSFETMQPHKDGDSSSSCSSSDSEVDPEGLLADDVEPIASEVVIHNKLGPLVPGELTVYDLPPIEELIIDIGKEVALTELGKVVSMFDCLVVVKANIGVRALDEATVLFAEGRRAVGKVFETFGPVISPFYSIRFNSASDVDNSGLAVGDTIYFAASEERSLTNYVFLDQSQTKGSDASWTQNHEPPEKFLDYSDDETERMAKARHRNKERKVNPCTEESRNDGAKKVRSLHQPSTSGGSSRPRRRGDHRQGHPTHQGNQSHQGSPHTGHPPHQYNQPYQGPQVGHTPTWTGYRPHPPHYPSPQIFGTPPTFYSNWQAYSGAWSEKDSDYYTDPSKPASQFVDTRFVQQSDDTPPQ